MPLTGHFFCIARLPWQTMPFYTGPFTLGCNLQGCPTIEPYERLKNLAKPGWRHIGNASAFNVRPRQLLNRTADNLIGPAYEGSA